MKDIVRPKTLKTIIPAALNNLRQGATFLSVKEYYDNFGGISDFGIVFHVNYLKAVKKSINIWRNHCPISNIEKLARDDLIRSYSQTLRGHNPKARSAHAYRQITDGNSLIKSVKWHDNGRAIHFWGFGIHKRIIKQANYPPDTRSQFSVSRERLLQLTPLFRFRQFKIIEGRFGSIGVEHLTLTQKDLIKNI